VVLVVRAALACAAGEYDPAELWGPAKGDGVDVFAVEYLIPNPTR
jgi:hypothetical protein